jgi:import receptor subunit TOM7
VADAGLMTRPMGLPMEENGRIHCFIFVKTFSMRDETKDVIVWTTNIIRRVLHIGFIPFIIYMGITRSTPRPSLLRQVVFTF